MNGTITADGYYTEGDLQAPYMVGDIKITPMRQVWASEAAKIEAGHLERLIQMHDDLIAAGQESTLRRPVLERALERTSHLDWTPAESVIG